MGVQKTIDIHCHPSLKTYLYNSDLSERHIASAGSNPFHVQVDFPKMMEGKVNAILASHYLPEIGLRRECKLVKGIYGGLKFLFSDITDKLESDKNFQAPFEQTLQMLKIFESKVHEASARGFDVMIARSYEEFVNGLSDGKTMILHAIEGAHSLGRQQNNENISEESYHSNLDQFYELGVCMITLSHFFENDLAPPVNGIPPSLRKLLICSDRDLNQPLTEMGEKIISRMLDKGIIVDLTHMTPKARNQVFNLNDERGSNKRPIVFSHVGVAKMFRNSKHQNDSAMNPTKEEILRIKECNGIIGVVFIKYWLVGKEEKDFWIFDLFADPGFKHIYKTIKNIHRVTGTYDNIALGSDFDGFTDPPDDLKGSSKFPALIEYLSNKGISDDDLEKITSGNILRVLKEGWGK